MSETPTYTQINEQKSSAYMSRSDADPTVLIKRSERSGGGVTVGRLDMDTREVHFSEDDKKWKKKVSLESLTDDNQARLAIELAGKALLNSAPDLNMPTAQEQQPTIDPLDQLPSSVKDEVLAYRRVVRNKQESERNKNFAQAAEDGRAIYRVEQSLSPEAKRFLGLN